MRIERVEVVDERGQRRRVTASSGMCQRVTDTELREDTEVVRLVIRGGREPNCEYTDDRGVFYDVTITLDSPLGDREVIDGSCPYPRPTEGEGGCDLPLEVVRVSRP